MAFFNGLLETTMKRITIFSLLCLSATAAVTSPRLLAQQPNIIWIISEDASPHIGCYGETAIQTPHLDRMAAEGVKFTRAFVTGSVCSPSRSAMISGMYQTTLGAHNHRSQRRKGRGGGNTEYHDSYRLPDSVRLIPQLFAEAGYFVANGPKSKTEYNFLYPEDLYHGTDWKERKPGQPFFAQFHLRCGKSRSANVASPADPAKVTLPPYYPDDPVIRADWAKYLDSWVYCDQRVGEVLARLEAEGIADETIVFFWTDHGISHARGKQFLYDEGIRVPLIVRFPGGKQAGTVRDDVVGHIDVAAASLDLAGIPIPDYVQGRPLFAENHQPRQYVFAARDRCDETVDIIRCVRTKQFKYLRNFLSHVSHMQPNGYKDRKEIIRRMRELHAAGQLNPLQARIFAPARPPEELYDLENDPGETKNLFQGNKVSGGYKDSADGLRRELYRWMIDSGDVGLIPEPVLEELGRQNGTKYGLLHPPDNSQLMRSLFAAVEAAERKDVGALQRWLSHAHPALRWWAATGLGLTGLGLSDDPSVVKSLKPLLKDEFGGVRVAAAQALCRLGDVQAGIPVLVQEVADANLVLGLYAIRGLEMIGDRAAPALPTIQAARNSPFEDTKSIARRLTAKLQP